MPSDRGSTPRSSTFKRKIRTQSVRILCIQLHQNIVTRTIVLKKSRVSFDRLRIIESRNATLEETSNVAFCFFNEFIQISITIPLGAVDSGEYVLEWLQNHVKRRLELCGDVADTLRIITH